MKDPIDISIKDLQEIFPIALRDRRENADLFEAFIPSEDVKADLAFYASISKMLNEEGLGSVREYDRRMRDHRKIKKQFGRRALRFLYEACAAKIPPEEIRDLPDDHFPLLTREAKILSFFKRLTNSGLNGETGGNDARDSLPGEERAQLAEGWRPLAARIADVAGNLSEPDVDTAKTLLSLAEELVKKTQLAAEQLKDVRGELEQATSEWTRAKKNWLV